MQRRYAARRNSAYVFPGYTDDGEDTPRGRGPGRSAIERAWCNAAHLGRAQRPRYLSHVPRHLRPLARPEWRLALQGAATPWAHDPMMTQKYAKLAPGAVADEAAAVLDALALERPITGRAA